MIYFIGGSPCSGKSTLAEMLMTEYGFIYFKLDDHLFNYIEEAANDGKPYSAATLELDLEQTWMRDPQIQCDEEIAIYNEIFEYALCDIHALGTDKAIITEGAGYMPELMKLHDIPANRYICIVPAEAFQLEHFSKRTWIGEFLAGCKKPDTAFRNWMNRDVLFANEMIEQAKGFGYGSIVVDGTRSIQENYRIVVNTFELSLSDK